MRADAYVRDRRVIREPLACDRDQPAPPAAAGLVPAPADPSRTDDGPHAVYTGYLPASALLEAVWKCVKAVTHLKCVNAVTLIKCVRTDSLTCTSKAINFPLKFNTLGRAANEISNTCK